MLIKTLLTDMFDLQYPIVLAPMGGVSGGRLAAAVSNSGGLGLVGGAYGDHAFLERELKIVKEQTQRTWGVGVITWHVKQETVELALSYDPHVFMLSFGDPRPYAKLIKAQNCKLICQVQDEEQAKLAVEAGADLIVAQGTESGGHGAARATLPLVPAIVDTVSPIPVLAAGGIADGRGVAAALMLGAEGAVIGTRFYATEESIGHPRAKEAIVTAKAKDVERTTVFDIIRGFDWPQPFTGRAVRNEFFTKWHGREDELIEKKDELLAAYQEAIQSGEVNTISVFAGEGLSLIDRVESAADVMERIGREAAECLRRGARVVQL
jgi:nitronate monooxygenase